MRIPFFTRQQQQPATERRGYADAVLDALLASVASPSARASATAAAETAIGLVSGAFRAAQVVSPAFLRQTLTSGFLASIGRDLGTVGNSVWLLQIDEAGRFVFHPAFDWDIAGRSLDPARWSYALKLATPGGDVERKVGAGSVLHVKINPHPSRPWAGRGPLQLASADSEALGRIADSLRLESRAPVGHAIPLPHGAPEANATRIANALGAADGKTQLLEALNTYTKDTANLRDEYNQKDFGPRVPAGSIQLHDSLTQDVLKAFGLSTALFLDGNSALVARRAMYLDTILPMAKAVEDALTLTLGVGAGGAGVALSFEHQQFRDHQRTSRAFKTMVESGIKPLKAAEILGLPLTDADLADDFEQPSDEGQRQRQRADAQHRNAESQQSQHRQNGNGNGEPLPAIEYRG